MKFAFWILVCLTSVITDTFCQRLPTGIEACRKDDPQRNDCILQTLTNLLPLMKDGNNLGLPTIDPIAFDGLPFKYDTPQTKLTFTLKKGTCYGFGQTQIKRVRTQITDEEWRFHIDIFVPRVFIEAKYRGQGNINGMNLGSKGDFNVTATGLSGTMKVRGKLEQISGNEFWKVSSVELVPKVKGLRTYIEGLVPDPELNRIALEFVNEYIAQNRNDLLKETRLFFDPLITPIANAITLRIPAKNLLV